MLFGYIKGMQKRGDRRAGVLVEPGFRIRVPGRTTGDTRTPLPLLPVHPDRGVDGAVGQPGCLPSSRHRGRHSADVEAAALLTLLLELLLGADPRLVVQQFTLERALR